MWVLPHSVPQGINYQAAVRDNSGNALANTAVSFRVSILKGATDGPSQYTETHRVTTNAQGMANFVILRGTHVSGNSSAITWTQEGPYFLKVEMDREGGSDFQLMGTSEMLSVPYALSSGYALYALQAGPSYQVGQLAEGGMVIATWDEGRHGLVVALDDESKGTNYRGAVNLVQAKSTGGYLDWRLPTLTQLKMIYNQRATIPNLTGEQYWSQDFNISDSGVFPFVIFFNNEEEGNGDWDDLEADYTGGGVRAVRQF